jgi:hypothetical protein
MYILEKEDNDFMTLTYVRATEQEFQDAWIKLEFIRYSVRSIPVFKDIN